MRINIKGNDIAPEKIAAALAACERDYNLKISGATIYVRFENGSGQAVEPLQDGEEFSRTFWFQKRKTSPASQLNPVPTSVNPVIPADAISVGEMIHLCQGAAHRMLSNNEMKVLIEIEKFTPVSKYDFKEALQQTIQHNNRFSIQTLRRILVK